MHLKDGGSGAVRTDDFHDCQTLVVQQMDAVVTSGKFFISDVELKWNIRVQVPHNLRMRVVREKRKCKNRKNQKRQELSHSLVSISDFCLLVASSEHVHFSLDIFCLKMRTWSRTTPLG